MLAAAVIVYSMVGIFTAVVFSMEEDGAVGVVVGLLWPLIAIFGIAFLVLIAI